MNEEDVRSLVREAIERHLGRPAGARGARGATEVAPYGGESSGATKVAPYGGESSGATEVAPYGSEPSGSYRADAAASFRRARLQSSDHPSHTVLHVLPGSEVDDGACVIEPAVRCNHCGFCQSYGH